MVSPRGGSPSYGDAESAETSRLPGPVVRIAISGAHRTGKSTLVEDLCRSMPHLEAVEEPYRLLEEEGHAFGRTPSVDDFELQLERSIGSILEAPGDRVFDRCPADFLAYLATHPRGEPFDPNPWLPRVRSAMERLDLVVLVSIERPDRVELSADDHPRWRRAVDEELKGILRDDVWDLGVRPLEVSGGPSDRLRQVLEHLRSR